MSKPRPKYCHYSGDVLAGVNKWGKKGEIVQCRGCGRSVKLRSPPNGSMSYYVQVPRHIDYTRTEKQEI